MRTKLKKCLALLLILVTCFCILDNIFIGSGFFAKLIMPEAHAEDDRKLREKADTKNEADSEKASENMEALKNDTE